MRVVDVATQRVRLAIKCHSGKVYACGFIGGNHKGYTASMDRSVKLWDFVKGAPLRCIPTSSHITGAALSPVSDFLLCTCHQNGQLNLWNAQIGKYN